MSEVKQNISEYSKGKFGFSDTQGMPPKEIPAENGWLICGLNTAFNSENPKQKKEISDSSTSQQDVFADAE